MLRCTETNILLKWRPFCRCMFGGCSPFASRTTWRSLYSAPGLFANPPAGRKPRQNKPAAALSARIDQKRNKLLTALGCRLFWTLGASISLHCCEDHLGSGPQKKEVHPTLMAIAYKIESTAFAPNVIKSSFKRAYIWPFRPDDLLKRAELEAAKRVPSSIDPIIEKASQVMLLEIKEAQVLQKSL